MTPAEQVAFWADRLRDISAMGLHFSKNFHDLEAFRGVQTIAMEMMAVATGASFEELEPLRASVFARPTPVAMGDAAVIDEEGRILLIQRADNGKWAMPGGALEVGETPAEGVEREALEETGVPCRAVSLVGVFDSRFCGSLSSHHLYQFVFLCEPLEAGESEEPSHAVEVMDAGWFPEDGLPEDLDPGHVTRIPEAFRVWHGDQRVFFDGSQRSSQPCRVKVQKVKSNDED
jgi:ADP-ribose pyrophosphatase YjhB (NUDIX family)